MDPHIFELPRRIVVGNDVLEGIDNDFRKLGITGKPLVLVDETTFRIAGRTVVKSLAAWNPGVEMVPDSVIQEVERIVKLAGEYSCIVAVGGGKIIDVGKVVAHRLNKPFIVVPTAPSHDGIASERATLTDDNDKISVKARPPDAVVADVGVLAGAPPRLIASGAADVISNLTSVQDWKLARDRKGEYYSDYAAYLAKTSAKTVMRSAKLIGDRKERGIRDLMEALLTSSIAMSLAGTSRPASGAEHAFSHVLDSMGSPALHGEQCGVGSIMTSYLQGRDWKLIRDTLKQVGAPTTAKELGVSEIMVVKALSGARESRDRYSILDEKHLDDEGARKVAEATGVIGERHNATGVIKKQHKSDKEVGERHKEAKSSI